MRSLVTVGSRFISFLDDRRSGCLTSILTAHRTGNEGNHFFSLKFSKIQNRLTSQYEFTAKDIPSFEKQL